MESEESKVNLSQIKLTSPSEPVTQASISEMSLLDHHSMGKNSPNDQKVPIKDSPKSKGIHMTISF